MLLFALGLALLSLVAANDNLVGFHPNDPDLSRDDERMKDLPDHVRDAKADKELKCSGTLHRRRSRRCATSSCRLRPDADVYTPCGPRFLPVQSAR